MSETEAILKAAEMIHGDLAAIVAALCIIAIVRALKR